MAEIDPLTGLPKKKKDPTSVSERITGLLRADSPYLQQAGAEGSRQAHRRGLLNSSIAVQAAGASRIAAALPIASQEASQAHQTQLQGADIGSRERMQGLELTSREEVQGRDIESRERMQGRDIESTERLQGRELTSRQELQASDLASRERIAALDLESRERINSLNVSTTERQYAGNLAVAFENNYNSLFRDIMDNPDIPADARQQFLDHASVIRDSGYALLEQLYSFDLEWV